MAYITSDPRVCIATDVRVDVTRCTHQTMTHIDASSFGECVTSMDFVFGFGPPEFLGHLWGDFGPIQKSKIDGVEGSGKESGVATGLVR